ncbi:hypothetical protein HJ01_03236 [Flavobacterium frigoris PS1]|uniref:Uncharacterized protein n=1 Tax=Flavobacterium frigoris (strain PS1) TaxID=1086011 RepID=H7FVL2_FLAFP|nr:hypothetical protein HJ01_03236 [Flavobacterium frigoris PS1]
MLIYFEFSFKIGKYKWQKISNTGQMSKTKFLFLFDLNAFV